MSAHLPGVAPGPHNGVGLRGIGNAQSAKASSMILMLFVLSQRHATPLKSPATKHHCANREVKLQSNATFLVVNVTDVKRQNCECFLAVGRLSTKRGT